VVLADFSIFPLDKGESLSPYVARILTILDSSGLEFKMHSMGTNIEGEYDEVMSVIRDCFMELEKDCNRISLSIKIDYRKKPGGRIKSKIEKVEELSGINLTE
jgi:uncharacterized protein (TIGR00106 family)